MIWESGGCIFEAMKLTRVSPARMSLETMIFLSLETRVPITGTCWKLAETTSRVVLAPSANLAK
mgnify:CR=1 FL=1